MTPENTKEKVLKEIKELKGKIKIEEKRDIYSGELVRMHSKLKILEAKLESIEETLAEVGKVIDEVIFKKPDGVLGLVETVRKESKPIEGHGDIPSLNACWGFIIRDLQELKQKLFRGKDVQS